MLPRGSYPVTEVRYTKSGVEGKNLPSRITREGKRIVVFYLLNTSAGAAEIVSARSPGRSRSKLFALYQGTTLVVPLCGQNGGALESA